MAEKEDKVLPVTAAERKLRIEKARLLMAQEQFDAIILEPGAAMLYFTGIDWYLSERLMLALIPEVGELKFVCPSFEEERLRELTPPGTDIRTWNEHEDPYRLVHGILNEIYASDGKIGLEESIRYFVYEGLSKTAPKVRFVSANPVTVPCRAYKSDSEIALMQHANNLTVKAFKNCIANLKACQSQAEFNSNFLSVLEKYGYSGSIDVQFGKNSAFPHGSPHQSFLQEGDLVLMDGQCQVEGYWSDITRTIVFGEPTARQREVWNIEKEAITAAFDAAQPGATCESVDFAARKVIENAGFGPGYKLPGLPHRTGHGIGLEIHEHEYIVKGNKNILEPGLCFTIEPTIAIYGEFGIRLEDCVYITEEGPRYFSRPSQAIEQPFAD